MTDLEEELTKMLMESYDKGVADTKKAAEEVIVKAVEFAVKQEREACAKVCERMAKRCSDIRTAALEMAAENIRARGNS